MIFRPFTIEEEMTSRTHTEKQFSIDSILGKEVYVDFKKPDDFSNEGDFDSFMLNIFFFNKNLSRMNAKIQIILLTSGITHSRNLSTEKSTSSVRIK